MGVPLSRSSQGSGFGSPYNKGYIFLGCMLGSAYLRGNMKVDPPHIPQDHETMRFWLRALAPTSANHRDPDLHVA